MLQQLQEENINGQDHPIDLVHADPVRVGGSGVCGDDAGGGSWEPGGDGVVGDEERGHGVACLR